MNIKIINTTTAISDSEMIIGCANSFESLVSTLSTIKVNFEANWTGEENADRDSIIMSLNNSINFYQNKIIPALKGLGNGVNAYAIATEQLAAVSVDNPSLSGMSPSEYADANGITLDGYNSPAIIEDITTTNPGEIDAYLYEKAIEMGMTDEQAKMAIAISRYETGDYTSNRIVNDNNWGGIKIGSSSLNEGITTDSKNFVQYSNPEQGATDFLSAVKRCFDKGCTSFADIQKTYCNDTDANGYSHWLNTVTGVYKDRFIDYDRVMER